MLRLIRITLLTAFGWALVPATAGAQARVAAQTPIVVVFPYEMGAPGMAGIEKGIVDLLITDIAASGRVRVVERTRLQQLLEEQNLARTGAVDPETAVRLGRLLGACYAITGGITGFGNEVRLTGKFVSIETGQIDQRTSTIRGEPANVMRIIDDLSRDLISKLDLTGCPTGGGRPGDGAPAQQGTGGQAQQVATGGQAQQPAAAQKPVVVEFAKVLTPQEASATRAVKLDVATAMVYSNGLDALDKKDNAKAAQLFQQVIQKYKDFQPAIDNLKKAQGSN